MATSPVPIVDDDGVGLNVADDDDVAVGCGDNGWCWFIVCRIDEWICCKLCFTLRADGLFGWVIRRLGGSIVRTVAVDEVFGFKIWLDVERDGWDFNCTNDWDFGVNVDDVDIWPCTSFDLVCSSIKVVKIVESKVLSIRGGNDAELGGESLVGSVRCLIAVNARLNCVVNFFGFANIDESGVDIGESGWSWESDFVRLHGTNGFALWIAEDISNIFLFIVFSKFILPRFRPTRAAKDRFKMKMNANKS